MIRKTHLARAKVAPLAGGRRRGATASGLAREFGRPPNLFLVWHSTQSAKRLKKKELSEVNSIQSDYLIHRCGVLSFRASIALGRALASRVSANDNPVCGRNWSQQHRMDGGIADWHLPETDIAPAEMRCSFTALYADEVLLMANR